MIMSWDAIRAQNTIQVISLRFLPVTISGYRTQLIPRSNVDLLGYTN